MGGNLEVEVGDTVAAKYDSHIEPLHKPTRQIATSTEATIAGTDLTE